MLTTISHPYHTSLFPSKKTNSNDEAGLYITSYKKFEHRPPTMIKERVDKDYSSVLRSTLTSINKVNRTDVETLRSSIGVWVSYDFVPFFGAEALKIDESLR